MNPTPRTSLVLDREALFGRILSSLDELSTPLKQVFTLSHYRGLDRGQVAGRLEVAEEEVLRMLREAEHSFYQRMLRLRLEAFENRSGAAYSSPER